VTITGTEAYKAMLAHHRELGEELGRRADAVSGAVAAGRPHGTAAADLIAYLAGEVLPHAAAEEKTVYPAAAAHDGLAGMVGEMLAEHVTLSVLGARLSALTDGAAAAEQAQQIAGLFTVHAAKENEILLPALLTGKSVDLAALLDCMHDDAGHAGTPAPAGESQADDPQATVLSLLLQSAAALARAGDADRACRIAASAWAALRETRPVRFDGKIVACPVYQREKLDVGLTLRGPAILDQFDCTTVICAGQVARVDEWKNLIVTEEK